MPRLPTTDASPAPAEAFAILGNETRLQVLFALGAADEPLSFGEVFERVEYDTSANFTYHLDRLEGHFISRSDEGYALRRAGSRVIEAVLSGAVTDDPVMEPTPSEAACPFCAAPIEVSFHEEQVDLFCPECPGLFGDADPEATRFPNPGWLGYLSIPPAGVEGRSPTELLEAAWTWKHLEFIARGNELCPRCAAAVEYSVQVCEDHAPSGHACDRCGRRYAVQRVVDCSNCIYRRSGLVTDRLLASTALLSFLTSHGVNPVAPESFDDAIRVTANFEEEVRATDPLDARYTYRIGGDSLTLAIDEALDVVDATFEAGSAAT